MSLFLLFGCISFSYAQFLNDALRYATPYQLGSDARYKSMSGAFASLGGNMSAIAQNPASSAVFLYSKMSVSGGYFSNISKNTYLDIKNDNNVNEFDFKQMGGVLVFNQTEKDNFIQKISFAINYDHNYSYKKIQSNIAKNPSSLDKYFLYYAEGKELDLLKTRDDESISDLYYELGKYAGFGTQQAFLGYQSYLLNPTEDIPENTTYTSEAYSPNGVNQNIYLNTFGISKHLLFNIGFRIDQSFYIGYNYKINYIEYDEHKSVMDKGFDEKSNIQKVIFDNFLSVSGKGQQHQLGVVFKPLKSVRIGFSWHASFKYEITEKLNQKIETDRPLARIPTVIVDPQTSTLYDYQLNIPSKYIFSASYVLGKKAIFSFDYSYTDYREIYFSPRDNIYFSELNNEIKALLTSLNTFALGFEIRNDYLSIRCGGRYISSPFKENIAPTKTYNDLAYGFSFGFGINLKKSSLDFSYDALVTTLKRPIFNLGLTDSYRSHDYTQNFMLSYNFFLF